jgi:predicted nuclease of restriction endonuclease-like RecB superfamily
VVGRGLQKLLLDACTFADPPSAATLREEAFVASAALLAAPARTSDDHRDAVAERLGLHGDEVRDRLYADHPDQAVLTAVPAWTATQLIPRYNLALAQGLLLFARSLTVTVADADTGLRRRLLKALRFRRLLADIRGDDRQSLTLEISGPGSVLDQHSRYGMQLALFLPALACCGSWQAEIALVLPRGGPARLSLGDGHALPGDSTFLGHVPEEIAALEAALRERYPAWTWQDPQLLPHPDGEVMVPDLQVAIAGRTVAVEFFHRWHGHALRRRLDQLAAGWAPHLVIGVDRTLLRSDDAIAAHPQFLARGLAFSEIPAARPLAALISRIAGA